MADLLRVRELLRLTDQPLTNPALAARDVNTPAAQALALQLAQESLVLLKNSHVGPTPLLPLAPRVRSGSLRHIAVIGPLADQLEVADYAGPFNAVNNAQSSVLLAALSARARADKTAITYAGGMWPTLGSDSAVIDRGHFPSGLTVSYYTSADLTGVAALNRTEVMIASTFFLYGFSPDFPSNTFSARWTGAVVWPATVPNGRLLVNTGNGGRVRLTLDGQSIVDQWTAVGKCQPCAVPYAFVQGEAHALVLEYAQTGAGQQIALAWDLVGADAQASIDRAVTAAMRADVTVVAVGDNGRTSGEGVDRVSLELSGLQEALVHALAAVGRPLIVVMYSGRAPAIPRIAGNPNVTAIIEAYEPGQAQGEALVSVLYGEFNPGGHLPLTYPTSTGQVPFFYKSEGGVLHSHSPTHPPTHPPPPTATRHPLTSSVYVRVRCVCDVGVDVCGCGGQSQGQWMGQQLRRPLPLSPGVPLRFRPVLLHLRLLQPQRHPYPGDRHLPGHGDLHSA